MCIFRFGKISKLCQIKSRTSIARSIATLDIATVFKQTCDAVFEITHVAKFDIASEHDLASTKNSSH